MRHVRPSIRLAQGVGAALGGDPLLLGPMQPRQTDGEACDAAAAERLTNIRAPLLRQAASLLAVC